MQAILRAKQSDSSGASAKELEAHEIVFTPVWCVEFGGILAFADFGLGVCSCLLFAVSCL